jgi:D-amino-acid oxidase
MTAIDAVVVGAGVVGLTTAISLAEAGLTTRIISAEPSSRSTSFAAGALWGLPKCGPPDRTREWGRVGLSVLSSLAGTPAAGIRLVHGREVSAEPTAPAEWADLVPDLRLCQAAELPAGFVSGWTYTAPLVTMPVYLDYLRDRFSAAGGSISLGPAVTSLTSPSAPLDAPLVVNCTGVGARDLVPDPQVMPIRGQVVIVRNPGIEEFLIDHTMHGTHYVYVFPHGDVVLLGGTAEDGSWDTAIRPDAVSRIIDDCSAHFPALRGAEIVAHRVGLRPYRAAVRLEAEPLGDGRVLWHNYGHGGAGVSLSWGCARELTSHVKGG